VEIREQQHGAVKVIKPDGPLVGEDAAQFARHVKGVLSSAQGRCLVDASDIAFVDSQGLEALLEISEEAASIGQTPKLCCVNETVRLVLELTELAPMFEYFDEVNVGMRSFL